MKRILLPTDFSSAAENAFRYACKLFESEVCEYVLIHGFGIPYIRTQTHDWLVYEKIVVEAEKKLQLLAARLEPFLTPGRQHLRQLVLANLPVNAINRTIESEQIDWLVLGATGQDEALLLGSVVAEVIQTSRCNTLIVPLHSEPSPLTNVVFATNVDVPYSPDTLAPIRDFVLWNHSQLTLLTISPANHALAKSKTQAFSQHYFEGLRTQTVIEEGSDVLTGIMHYVDTHPTDLLIAISHQHSFLGELFSQDLLQRLSTRPLVPIALLIDRMSHKMPSVAVPAINNSLLKF